MALAEDDRPGAGPADLAIPEGSLSFFRRDERARPQPASGLAAGKTVGDFRLVALIGQGGMGQVWEAEQLSLGRRHVAVKFVRPERVSEHQLELFDREARAGGRLHHPGIVTVHGHGASDGLAWIAMELVSGAWTLRDFLDEVSKASELPATYDKDVARLVAGIADALHAAHEAGVIHRDVKPQNVLITPDDRPKVTDFGLARIIDESALSQTGEFAGTYFYMSPEQVTAKRIGLDHRTDVFSLGVVLYELLALQRPFQGDTSQQVAAQIVTKDPPDPRTIRSKVPRDLAVIAGKALEKAPERRFPTMAELAADLRRWLASEPIHARPPTRWDRATKWVKRNPAKSAVAGVVASALVVISSLLAENVRARGAAERRADEVLRLSALQELEDLAAEADELWPARPESVARYEDCLARARDLVRDLPRHRETLERVFRARALPQSEEERRAERESHPDHPELTKSRASIALRRQALAQRRDGVAAELPGVDWNLYPSDPAALNEIGWPMIAPERVRFGEEATGLVLARRAAELAPENPNALDSLAWASFAFGLDDEALSASSRAIDAAPPDQRTKFEAWYVALEERVERASSEESLAQEELDIAALERRAQELEARVGTRREWRFSEEQSEARWWNRQLTKLIEKVEELDRTWLGEDRPASLVRIRDRLALATKLREGFGPGGEFTRAWEQALPRIRRTYPDLDLGPQVGLVPLGTDPRSGLWEFADLQTGAVPERSEQGVVSVNDDTGLVFVLLPGGTFEMGSQRNDPGAPNYDPDSAPDESPVHEVTLPPFFLSKYEMTQGQWLRASGANPSQLGPHNSRNAWSRSGRPMDLSHPVENVSWNDASAWCARLGLALPSEAQWEHAARAGTSTPWWGAEDADLALAANVADAWAREHEGTPGWTYATIDDGYSYHAPAGSSAPNPFGFHEMLGNVWEWCQDGNYRDAYLDGNLPAESPVAPANPAHTRVRRGGSFAGPLNLARSAARSGNKEDASSVDCGLRPARAIDPRPR